MYEPALKITFENLAIMKSKVVGKRWTTIIWEKFFQHEAPRIV